MRILPGLMFKSVEDAGRWHLKSVDGYNHMRNANRKRAGRPRMSKAEFRKRLMEDLKHMKRESGGLTMTKNKMEQVAQMFGKKLGEEFKLKFMFLPGNRIHTVKFTRVGLECLNTYNKWEPVSCCIPSLLIGTAEIVEE